VWLIWFIELVLSFSTIFLDLTIVLVRCAAEVWQLLILVSKGMFSRVELLVLLAVLSDI